MATQIKYGTPGAEYCVVDNSAAPTFPSLNAGAHLGYDTTAPGATSQGSNAFTNGTIPGFLASGATTVLNSSASTRLLYRNPA